MAGGALGDDGGEITEINVTPLVDVMLVLLVIFMVTANYIVQNSINVNLPKAESGAEIVSKNLAFVLDKSSNLFLNGQPTTFENLPNQITEERNKAQGQNLQALIAADTETPHGTVVKLIDAVRKNGITDFAINVEALPVAQ